MKYNFQYTHQILDGNNIDTPYTENRNHVQIITSFVYVLLMMIVFIYDIRC